MNLEESLRVIDNLLRETMHPLSYMAEEYSDLMKLPVDEGIEKARKAYEKAKTDQALSEYDKWGMKQIAAHKKLIFAIYSYAKEKQEIPLEGKDIKRAMEGSLMDTTERINTLADYLLHEITKGIYQKLIKKEQEPCT